MINILYIIDSLMDFGGTERHLFYLSSHLDPKRFRCAILTFKADKEFLSYLRERGLTVYHLDILRVYNPKTLLRTVDLIKIIRENRIDIVQTFQSLSDTYGVAISRFSRVKTVISSRRDTGFKKGWLERSLNRIFNRMCTKFIVVSDDVKECLSRNEAVPISKQVMIYNGIDLDLYVPPTLPEKSQARVHLGISDTDFVLGIVGHLRPEKGHEVFFESFLALSNVVPDLKAIVVGDGNLYPTYRDWATATGMSDRILFTGVVIDVREYIKAFDIACLTSHTEGFSNAILEYMALERPVIATAVGGTREIIRDGENGLLVPPADPVAFYEGVLRLHRDRCFREMIGKAGRRDIEDRFTLNMMISKHQELYLETTFDTT